MPLYGTRRDSKVSNDGTMISHKQLTLEALRSFTLESGQEEIERRNRRRKERSMEAGDVNDSRRGSADSLRSSSISHSRTPALSDVPEEEGTFAIGDDEDEDTDDDHGPTPAESTPTEQPSRASSVSSSVDETVPVQLRGMSEKARGKMPGNTIRTPRHFLTNTNSWHANLLSSEQYHEPK